MKQSYLKRVITIGVMATLIAPPTHAESGCVISSDVTEYYERREQAIILMQYEDLVIRATYGPTRCHEDAESTNQRQICLVEGQGELLVEGGDRAAHLVRLTTDAPGEVHIYANGNLSCGLKSDFDKNR